MIKLVNYQYQMQVEKQVMRMIFICFEDPLMNIETITTGFQTLICTLRYFHLILFISQRNIHLIVQTNFLNHDCIIITKHYHDCIIKTKIKQSALSLFNSKVTFSMKVGYK